MFVKLDALVLIPHQPVAHQREIVLRDELVLEAVVRHADVIVVENLEAGVRLEVRQLAVVDGVHGRDGNLWNDVVEVPLEVVAFETLSQVLASLQ